jgi:prepilin-type N-terminal cleavage/methylation domain-containing protein/prepilin-type processing-associated H-X9-DG protein
VKVKASDLKLGAINDGFTLLELLVVMGVIATLVGLTFPIYSHIVTSGRMAASISNLTQLAAANLAYVADNNGYFCPAQERRNLVRWHGARTSANGAFDPSKGFLAKYLGAEGRVKICPLLTQAMFAKSSFEDGTGGYGYNEVYIGGTPQDPYTAALVSQISRPSQTVMFTTAAYARTDGVQEYPFCEPPFWDFGGGPTGSRPSPTVHFRANGKALVAWCDGHVSAETPVPRADGSNPHGGDADKQHLGWFGPDDNNGYWNSKQP